MLAIHNKRKRDRNDAQWMLLNAKKSKKKRNSESENQLKRMAANLFRQCILRSLDLTAVMNESSRIYYLLTFSELTHRHIVIRTQKTKEKERDRGQNRLIHIQSQHEDNRWK